MLNVWANLCGTTDQAPIDPTDPRNPYIPIYPYILCNVCEGAHSDSL